MSTGTGSVEISLSDYHQLVRSEAQRDELLKVASEADTLSQNISELLREYEVDDRVAKDLHKQVKALGDNARAAIARCQKGAS